MGPDAGEVTFESDSPTAILRIGDSGDAVSTPGLTSEELRARQDLANLTYTSAEVGYKNTAEPAGREVWMGAATIGNTDNVFHADPTVTFRSDEELEQGPTRQPTAQLPMTPADPGDQVSRPVEVPRAPAEKPTGGAQVEGTGDVAHSAAGTRDSSEQLTHAGAEKMAALAALALVGTGITSAGFSRRQTA